MELSTLGVVLVITVVAAVVYAVNKSRKRKSGTVGGGIISPAAQTKIDYINELRDEDRMK